MKKTQQGIALVETLLIILILAIIGFGGYYVWHTQKDNNKVTDDTLKAGNSQTAASKIKDSGSNSSQKNVAITEWGVKAPYSGNLTLRYLIKDNFATFWSDEAIKATNGQCEDFMGGIARYAPSDYILSNDGPTAEQDAKAYPDSYVHIGNYYYIFRHSQAVCPDVDESNTSALNLIGDTNNAVRDLSTNLQAAQ